MSVEIAKKRGRPKKVVDLDGPLPSGLPSSKPSLPKKTIKPPPSTSIARKKSNGNKSKDIPITDAATEPRIQLTKRATTIARPTTSKTASGSKLDSPPPEVVIAIAAKESSNILQQLAALRVEEELKKAAGLSTTHPPNLPNPPEPLQLAKPQPRAVEPPTIPSSQSSTMPSTSTPPTTYYQWLPNPPILTQQTAFRTLSTTTRYQSQNPKQPSDVARRAKALNRLATEASIPKAKEGLNPGGFPVTYKSATRRITAIIVAAPIALCMSWFLYERLVLGVEQKKLVPDAPGTSTKVSGEDAT